MTPKPTIKRFYGTWVCFCPPPWSDERWVDWVGHGESPREAYDDWLVKNGWQVKPVKEEQ